MVISYNSFLYTPSALCHLAQLNALHRNTASSQQEPLHAALCAVDAFLLHAKESFSRKDPQTMPYLLASYVEATMHMKGMNEKDFAHLLKEKTAPTNDSRAIDQTLHAMLQLSKDATDAFIPKATTTSTHVERIHRTHHALQLNESTAAHPKPSTLPRARVVTPLKREATDNLSRAAIYGLREQAEMLRQRTFKHHTQTLAAIEPEALQAIADVCMQQSNPHEKTQREQALRKVLRITQHEIGIAKGTIPLNASRAPSSSAQGHTRGR